MYMSRSSYTPLASSPNLSTMCRTSTIRSFILVPTRGVLKFRNHPGLSTLCGGLLFMFSSSYLYHTGVRRRRYVRSWRHMCGNRLNVEVLKNNAHPLGEDPDMCGAVYIQSGWCGVSNAHLCAKPPVCAILMKTTADIAAALRVYDIAATRPQYNQQTRKKLHTHNERRGMPPQ